jgi:hypothetical protein
MNEKSFTSWITTRQDSLRRLYNRGCLPVELIEAIESTGFNFKVK